MIKIKTIELEGEKIYLKKSLNSWKIVHPIKIDGKINWKNLISGGKWSNLLIVLGLVIIILFCLNDWAAAIKTANKCLQTITDPLGLNYRNVSNFIAP